MTETALADGPEPPPADVGDARSELAGQFLHGDGLEIGALHLATVLPPGSHTRYVDRMSVSDLRIHYPELAELDLAPVDVIDDGERLETIEPESVDFVVANHFLEHCEDPIRTIETHLGKLRPGGTLFYAVPDKRYTFDFRRPRTPLEHVIADHERGPEQSRAQHYLEWSELIYEGTAPSDEQARITAAALQSETYSIHFHVWTQADLVALMFHIHERLGGFEVEAIQRRNIENIVVLRKHGEPSPGRFRERAVRSAAGWTGLSVERRTAVPLAGLRARLDHGSALAHWSIEPDGLLGRAWVISTEALVTVPLTLDCPVMLQARAQLLPHDWRDGTGGVDAWAAVNRADDRHEMLWTSTLTPATDPAGIAIDFEIPTDSIELQFGIAKRGARSERSIARMALVEPYLTDPLSDAAGALEHAAGAPSPLPADGPLVSVLCPVHDPVPYMLQEAVESVRAQTYGNWELVLSDDGSADPEVVALLDRYPAQDKRIRLVRRPAAGGISIATNTALAYAAGAYVALLDHDDTLDRHALAHVARVIAQDPELDMIYTDEGVLSNGEITAHHRKPGWSPELLEVAMYTTHLGVYRRSLADELGGFSAEFDGTQDYDFVLRLSETTDRIAHVPKLLYHWRAHASSTAGGEQAKPYAYTIQPAAIDAHLRRRGIDAEVQHGAAPGLHRIVHRVDPESSVTIVLSVENAGGLHEAAHSWASQSHANWRLIVSAPAEHLPAVVHALGTAGVGNSRITAIAADPTRGPTAAMDAAARRAHTDQLLLMRIPMLGLTHDWLARLMGYADRDGIAAAGPVVLTHDGRIAYAGIAIPKALPLPLLHGLDGAAAPSAAIDVTGLDGALVTTRAVYGELDGLDPDAGALALVDYCLRAAQAGRRRAVLVPDVRLRTIGQDVSTNDLPRLWELGRRFSLTHERDPYYSPGYYSDRGDFQPRGAAMAVRP